MTGSSLDSAWRGLTAVPTFLDVAKMSFVQQYNKGILFLSTHICEVVNASERNSRTTVINVACFSRKNLSNMQKTSNIIAGFK